MISPQPEQLENRPSRLLFRPGAGNEVGLPVPGNLGQGKPLEARRSRRQHRTGCFLRGPNPQVKRTAFGSPTLPVTSKS